MGNTHSTNAGSSVKHSTSPPRPSTPPIDIDTIVDGGRILPVSHVYATTPQPESYNRGIIQKLILDRRLAPFFRGLEDYDSSWGEQQIEDKLKEADEMARNRVKKATKEAEEEMKQRQEAKEQAQRAAERAANEGAMRGGAFASLLSTGTGLGGGGDDSLSNSFLSEGGDAQTTFSGIPVQASTSHRRKEKELPLPPVLANPPHIYPYGPGEKEKKGEISCYLGEAVECPICFLNYSPLINRSRCCQQEICTECFIQIKRADPTITNPSSEPACCPYCGVPNFGIVYDPPRVVVPDGETVTSPSTTKESQRRRKSIAANSPEVVLVDHIHPNWESKLASVQATIARRANRRWVFRQVGERLIPIGITSGRSNDTTTQEESRRNRRRGNGDGGNGQIVMSGQDLEELMVMEAMRLSLLEQEEREKKEREAQAAKGQTAMVQPIQTVAQEHNENASRINDSPSLLDVHSQEGSSSHSGTPRQMTPQHTGHSGISSLFHRRKESHSATSIITSGLQAASIVTPPIPLPKQIQMQGGGPRSSHSMDDFTPSSVTPITPINSSPPTLPPIPSTSSLRPPLSHHVTTSSVGDQSMTSELTETASSVDLWDGHQEEGYQMLPETPALEREEFMAQNSTENK